MIYITKTIKLIIILAILFMSQTSASGSDLLSKMIIKPKTRVKAPSFTLHDINGNEKKLEEFNGKVILLNFWATWCAPCREEMPDMEKLWKRFSGKEFVIIAVAADRGSKEKIQEFSKTHNLTFPVLLDADGKVRNRYEVTALPMSYIIGKDSKIIGKVIGARKWDGSEAVKMFENLLGKEIQSDYD